MFKLVKDRISIKALSGGLWVGGGELFTRLVHLITFYSLAFYIDVEDFGVFAVAWIVVAFAESFFDFGAGYGYLFDQDDSEESYSSFYLFSFLCALCWIVILLAVAPLVSMIFSNDDVLNIIYSLSLIFFIKGFVNAPMNYLTIKGEHKQLSISLLLSAVVGGLAGIYFAANDYGVWSFVFRYIASFMFLFLLLRFLFGFRICFLTKFSLMHRWIKFGYKITISNNLAWLVVLQVEQFLVSFFFGPVYLGLYNFAKKPIDITLQVINQLRDRFLFPYFSGSSSISKKFILVFLGSSFFVGCFFCSIAFLFIDWMVYYLWGNKWVDSLGMIYVLLLILPLSFSDVVFQAFFSSKGYAALVLRSNFLYSFFAISLMLFSAVSGFDVLYICWSLVLSYFVKLIFYIYAFNSVSCFKS